MKRMKYYRNRRMHNYWQSGSRFYEINDEFADDMDFVDLDLRYRHGNIRKRTLKKLIYQKWRIPKI